MTDFFDFAERHGLALFPCAAGTKRPILPWKKESSPDRKQWVRWAAEGHNLAIDCAKSGLVVVDVDCSKVTPKEASAAYHSLCQSWGLPTGPAVMTQSARGGWHAAFKRPADLAATDLRGGGTLIKISDVRALADGELDGEVIGFKNRGYCVAPGSRFEGQPYLLLPDAPAPHECPAGLVELIRLPVVEAKASGPTGVSEPTDVARLVAFLDGHGEFDAEPDWFNALGAIKLACGDTEQGLLVARQITRDDASEEAFISRWNRLVSDASARPGVKLYTIGSMIKRAEALGQKFRVGKSTVAMFQGVAEMLPTGAGMLPALPPLPYGTNSSTATSLIGNTAAIVADLGRPTVEAFIAANQNGFPATEAPQIPDAASGHPLFESLNAAIVLIVGNAERSPKAFRANTNVDMLAVLSIAHEATFMAVCARIRNAGAVLPESRLTAAVARFEAKVSREIRTGAGWATDAKGMPDGANTDNVAVFARTIGVELRFNAWSNRAEIRWSESGNWNPMQEKDFNHLLTTAGNGQYNFRPRESMFKRALSALAYEATFDPVLERLAAAQAAWDGVPRLGGWLARALGAPNDAYHAAVGRSLLGGICKRVRHPGCKHDDVVILMGPEDTLKSTFCRALALQDDWFSDSVDFSGSPQNTVPQLFGRVLIELAELDGMERREVQHIKRFLSAQTDNVTLKYEAFTSDHARRCVFVGTSNEDNPLRGDAGNRRFLPVKIEQRIDVDFVRANLDLLIGEAATLEAAGDLFLMPQEVLPDARARQEAVRAQSDFEIHLHGWFAEKAYPGYILPADLASLLKDATGRSVPPNQYGKTMRRLGFEQMTPRLTDGITRVWCRGNMDGAHRYSVHRLSDNRLAPKMMFAGAMGQGGATVVPMARAQ
jgi:hypothetical protein